jgi:PAS domain S-box-containing protein
MICMFVYLPSICIAAGEVQIEGKKNVLILNSYHQGYKWTDDETQGAIAGLDPPRNDFKVVIEYMGTKWAYAEPYLEQLRSAYKYKFQGIRFDLIIATDDDAFNFLKRNRDELFPDTPVVFCGVNWFKPESVPAGFKGYTGVNEDADIPATLDSMLNLHPGAKKIFVVTDMTTTGKKVHAEFAGIIPKYKDKVSFTFLDDMDMSEILDTVGKLGDDSLVLITVFQKDKAGTFFEFDESTRLISKSTRVPVYGLWDFDLGFGIVGGMLTSGYNQGKTAGQVAVRILKGEKADAIPVLMKSPNRFMFDYTQMQRWNISRSNLPADSVVINEPPSFYAVNKGQVWGLLSGFVGWSIVILVLFINTVRRKNVILTAQQEASMDGILVVDESGTIVSYNRHLGDLWEITPDLAKTKDFAQILQSAAGRAADPESYMARVKYLCEHKEEKSREEVFLKDGRVFDRYSAPMRGGDGKYYGRVWYFRDITERKRMEDALWKSESILRKIFESIPDMLSVIDRDLRIVHSNWQGGYEYVPEEVRSGNPHCYDAYYPEQGKPCDDCHAIKVFRTGRPVTTEKYNPRIGLMEVRVFPIYDDSGEVVMVAEYIRNITEQKRVEEELRKGQKLESLGVLAGGIAHDFNNLLTGILGNISMAKIITASDSKTLKRLDEAEKAVWRARDLTQQLMTFSKGGTPVKTTASMEQIVMDSASFVLRGSNVRCKFAVPEDVWPVEVDEGQMNQVMNNLIINADQSMVDGGIIEVGIENLTIAHGNEMLLKEGRYVKITIRDHGAGIPEEYIHRIFDPYFTTKQKGSGLGLASVYSIIRNHDGYVDVESKVGTGTTFRIYIPASEKRLPEVMETKEILHAGSGRILVMDDEEIIREVAAEILVHLGYSAVLCSDGSEAVETYRQAFATTEPFTAVIMDLTVPGGMGGKEAAARIRDIDPDAVLIVSSGYSSDPIIANFHQYGFSGVVPKPFDAEGLARELKRLIPSQSPSEPAL